MQQQKTSQTSQTRYDGVYRQKGAALPSLAAPGMYVVELPDGTLLQNAMGQNRRFSSLSRALIWIDRA